MDIKTKANIHDDVYVWHGGKMKKCVVEQITVKVSSRDTHKAGSTLPVIYVRYFFANMGKSVPESKVYASKEEANKALAERFIK